MNWEDINGLILEAEGIAEKINDEGILYPKQGEVREEPPPRCEACEG